MWHYFRESGGTRVPFVITLRTWRSSISAFEVSEFRLNASVLKMFCCTLDISSTQQLTFELQFRKYA